MCVVTDPVVIWIDEVSIGLFFETQQKTNITNITNKHNKQMQNKYNKLKTIC